MHTVRLAAFILIALPLAVSAKADFAVVAGWDNQLFPAYLIATASVKPVADESGQFAQLGDPHGVIGVVLTAAADGERVNVTVSCDEFMEASSFSCALEQAGETYRVFPKIRFRYDRLSKCRQATPATVIVKVQIDSAEAEEQSTTVVVRSINDCPLRIVAGEESIDTQFTFAAFVNEEHPYVDKLLREALDRGIVDNFYGYQGQDSATVFRQVYALWDLIVARDVRYSDITTTAAGSTEVLSQHVRLIEETANNSQANCVDGSVLFVSMLRKIGINASLVLEPRHCYVVFSSDEAGKMLFGLETTAVDAVLEEPEEIPEFLSEAVAEELRGEQSWPSFISAIASATHKLKTNIEKYETKTDPSYTIINIAEARLQGILPIAFDAHEQFVAYDHSGEMEDSETEQGDTEGSDSEVARGSEDATDEGDQWEEDGEDEEVAEDDEDDEGEWDEDDE